MTGPRMIRHSPHLTKALSTLLMQRGSPIKLMMHFLIGNQLLPTNRQCRQYFFSLILYIFAQDMKLQQLDRYYCSIVYFRDRHGEWKGRKVLSLYIKVYSSGYMSSATWRRVGLNCEPVLAGTQARQCVW